MPTSRPRHSVTETDEVAAALAAAARRWPQDSRSPGRLLMHLLEEGHRAIQGASDDEGAARRARVEAVSGVLTGVYTAAYLQDLRDDWPA